MPTQNVHVTPKFYLALLEFLLTMKHQVVSVADEYDLTAIQALMLLLIDTTKPRPMGSLSALFHCDASNITGIIDGLEQKGLAERQNDPTDRRVKVVCLTGKGSAMQAAMLRRLGSDASSPFSTLDAQEQQQLVSIIHKVV